MESAWSVVTYELHGCNSFIPPNALVYCPRGLSFMTMLTDSVIAWVSALGIFLLLSSYAG